MSTELTSVKKEAAVVDTKSEVYDFEVVDLIRVAVERGMDIEKLLELREKIKKERAQEEFTREFSQFQSELPEVVKDKKVLNKDGTLRYQYASLDSILVAIKPLLTKHKLSITFKTQVNNDSITVTCVVKHIAGHSEETSFTLPIDDSPHISKIQRYGSTLTYARRYALSLALGLLSTDEDNDGNVDTTIQTNKENENNQKNQEEMITEAQMKALFALLKDKTKDEKLQIASSILGRQVNSSKELTKREASKIIETLKNEKEPF